MKKYVSNEKLQWFWQKKKIYKLIEISIITHTINLPCVRFHLCLLLSNIYKLILLKIYQTRHPDINASAYRACLALASVIFLSVIGVKYGSGKKVGSRIGQHHLKSTWFQSVLKALSRTGTDPHFSSYMSKTHQNKFLCSNLTSFSEQFSAVSHYFRFRSLYLIQKNCEMDWFYLCLQQFDKFLIWGDCNNRKRK